MQLSRRSADFALFILYGRESAGVTNISDDYNSINASNNVQDSGVDSFIHIIPVTFNTGAISAKPVKACSKYMFFIFFYLKKNIFIFLFYIYLFYSFLVTTFLSKHDHCKCDQCK